MIKLLFVCTGNICRSPAAQAVMQRIVDEHGRHNDFFIDSAGTIDFHAGEQPDRRMVRTLMVHGYTINHESRPIHPGHDFDRFDNIIVMDSVNARWLSSRMTEYEFATRVIMLGAYISGVHGGKQYDHVPDPYYGTTDDFALALELIENACINLYYARFNK